MSFTKGMNLHSLNFITIVLLFSLTLSNVGELSWYSWILRERIQVQKRERINPLSLNSDQDQFSPNNIHTLSIDKLWE